MCVVVSGAGWRTVLNRVAEKTSQKRGTEGRGRTRHVVNSRKHVRQGEVSLERP